MIKLGTLITSRFLIEKKINAGTYGCVYVADDQLTHQKKAVKIIPKIRDNHQDDSFEKEVNALVALENAEGVVNLHSFGEVGYFRYIVMDLLDDDLDSIRWRNDNKSFRRSTVLQLVWNLVNIVETVHGAGFVHRDIKLNNLMIKLKNGVSKLILVDFGLAMRYKHQNGSRIPPAELDRSLKFHKSPFSSINVSKAMAFQESDDMETIAIIAIYMIMDLPWKSAKSEKEMFEMKLDLKYQPLQFLGGANHKFLIPILEVLFKQEYGRNVNYDEIRFRIQSMYGSSIITDNLGAIVVNEQIRLE